MANAEKEYRRLPGRGIKRGGALALAGIRAMLWEGKDHLLCLYRTRYTEDYKRFYYRDIQAFVIRKTARGAVGNGIALFFIILSGWLASLAPSSGAISLLAVSALSALLLLINWLRGPTCVCYLQTRVSREELPSLDRLAKAKQVIDLIRPRIEAAQGSLTADEIAAKSRERSPSDGVSGLSERGEDPYGPAFNAYGGSAHEALFYLLLMEGIFSAISLSVQHLAVSLSGWLLSFVSLIMAVVAVTRQHESKMGGGLKRVTWWSLVYLCASFAVNYALYTVIALKNPRVMNDQWQVLKEVAALSPPDSALLRFKLIFSIACTVSIAVAGLVLLRGFRCVRTIRSLGAPLSAAPVKAVGEAENE